MRSVAVILCGSWLYGTNVETSDRDYKIVYVPDARDILLQRGNRLGEAETRTAKAEVCELLAKQSLSPSKDPDIEFLSLHQYLKLLCQGQTNALDMLFAPPEFHLKECGSEWLIIRERSSHWVSRSTTSFVGYCRDQARKYIVKQDRLQALEAVVDFFRASEDKNLRLSELGESLSSFTSSNPHTELVAKQTAHGVQLDHLSVCQILVPVTATVRVALGIYESRLQEYGTRVRRATLEPSGKDWKSLYHALRVANEAMELLTTGRITLPRPERAFLKAVRSGRISFRRVSAMLEENLSLIEQAEARSTLPQQPDWGYAEQLLTTFYRAEVISGQV